MNDAMEYTPLTDDEYNILNSNFMLIDEASRMDTETWPISCHEDEARNMILSYLQKENSSEDLRNHWTALNEVQRGEVVLDLMDYIDGCRGLHE